MFLIISLCIFSSNVLSIEKVNFAKSQGISEIKTSELDRRVAVGGKDANIEDYPFMAMVEIYNPKTKLRSMCGASIINATHILTGAHCFNEIDPDIMSVVTVGVTIATDDSKKLSVKQFHIHPNYEHIAVAKKCRSDFDLAVLELVEPIQFSDKVSPVKLPEAVKLEDKANSKTNSYITDRKLCTVLGWGRTYEHENVEPNLLRSRPLKVANIPLIDTSSCKEYAVATAPPEEIDLLVCIDSHICTMDPLNISGICQGDSGGPLLCGGEQVGVNSGAGNCSGPNMPSWFARTDIIIDWLNGKTNDARIFHFSRFLFFISCLVVNALQ